MANFAQQRVSGNQVVSANKDDIHHTLTTNHTIATVVDKRNGNYERVRAQTSVQRKFGVSADCSDCKRKLDATCRIEQSIPLGLSKDDAAKYIATVFEPAVANARARLEGGLAHGFATTPDTSVGE